MRDVFALFADMREAADRATRHIQGMSKEQFFADEKTIDATVRCLAILGEAAKRVPLPERERWSELPWRELTGLRDRLVHDYLGTDLEIVWEVLTVHLPGLRFPEE